MHARGEVRHAISSKELKYSRMRPLLERLEFTHQEPIFYFKAPVPVMLPNTRSPFTASLHSLGLLRNNTLELRCCHPTHHPPEEPARLLE